MFNPKQIDVLKENLILTFGLHHLNQRVTKSSIVFLHHNTKNLWEEDGVQSLGTVYHCDDLLHWFLFSFFSLPLPHYMT